MLTFLYEVSTRRPNRMPALAFLQGLENFVEIKLLWEALHGRQALLAVALLHAYMHVVLGVLSLNVVVASISKRVWDGWGRRSEAERRSPASKQYLATFEKPFICTNQRGKLTKPAETRCWKNNGVGHSATDGGGNAHDPLLSSREEYTGSKDSQKCKGGALCDRRECGGGLELLEGTRRFPGYKGGR